MTGNIVLILLLSVFGAWCHGKLPIRDYSRDNWINKSPRPPVPAWPDQFTGDFYVYVEKYGEDFHPKGTIFYDWTNKVIHR